MSNFNFTIKSKPSALKWLGESVEHLITLIIWFAVFSIPLWLSVRCITDKISHGSIDILTIGLVMFILFILYPLYCLFTIPWNFLKLLEPSPSLSLNSNVLHAGDTMSLEWKLSGTLPVFKRLHIWLECWELTREKGGDETDWHKEKLNTIDILDTKDPAEISSGKASLKLEEDTMISFKSSTNRILWVLQFQREHLFRPQERESIAVTVLPLTESDDIKENVKKRKDEEEKRRTNSIIVKYLLLIIGVIVLCTGISGASNLNWHQNSDLFLKILSLVFIIAGLAMALFFFIMNICAGCKKGSIFNDYNKEKHYYCSPRCYFMADTPEDEKYKDLYNNCHSCGEKVPVNRLHCTKCEKEIHRLRTEQKRGMILKEKTFLQFLLKEKALLFFRSFSVSFILLIITGALIYIKGMTSIMADVSAVKGFLSFLASPQFNETVKGVIDYLMLEEATQTLWPNIVAYLSVSANLDRVVYYLKETAFFILLCVFIIETIKYLIPPFLCYRKITAFWRDVRQDEVISLLSPLEKELVKNNHKTLNYLLIERNRWEVTDELFLKYRAGVDYIFEYTPNSNVLLRINGEKVDGCKT